MNKRVDLILSSILQKFPKFTKITGKMPPDIEIFSNYICDLINLESQRLIEFYSQESLYFQENNSEEDSNSDGEESAESEDSDFDPDQEKEKVIWC